MPFQDTNTALGIAKSNQQFQVGRSNVDSLTPVVEQRVGISRPSPAGAWLYYNCTLGVMLDSGIVVHNRLPQVNRTIDSLSSSFIDKASPTIDTDITGVNLKCNDQYTDIVQRMGHSRYWFRLWGMALRLGYQVPIPGIKTIGGQTAIPYDKNPQWAFNRIFPGGNYGGIILWHAEWSLWYTTASPPTSNTIPAVDPSAHISGAAPLPDVMQAPYSIPDDNAVKAAPATKPAFVPAANIKG